MATFTGQLGLPDSLVGTAADDTITGGAAAATTTTR